MIGLLSTEILLHIYVFLLAMVVVHVLAPSETIRPFVAGVTDIRVPQRHSHSSSLFRWLLQQKYLLVLWSAIANRMSWISRLVWKYQ